jgi:hypothetical protein
MTAAAHASTISSMRGACTAASMARAGTTRAQSPTTMSLVAPVVRSDLAWATSRISGWSAAAPTMRQDSKYKQTR